MISLRKVSDADALMLSERFQMSLSEAKRLIDQSKAAVFHDKFFVMYVVSDEILSVGIISLYEQSASVVSIGPHVFEEYRQRGYATEAMKMAMQYAREKGFTIVRQQVRTNNHASINLHMRLGFETDKQIQKNRNQNDVFLYQRSL